ncbi:hypothetical protein [Phosphitispora fastidiosa]|uniref:hypothetical protein n=1 Tax=Phosphitispora fastidiosa TaxID=2837202 RepID=UPI001E41B084|nr:hypothetical protein [Phosphitispora fastidiosa]MBU7007885.1 hypothetical protein [Phosphitispora fastidiosa]
MLNYSNFTYSETAIRKLVRDLETARWVLYEIKQDSESGRLLKSIIFLIDRAAEGIAVDNGPINEKRLIFNLIEAGFDTILVMETVTRLFGKAN